MSDFIFDHHETRTEQQRRMAVWTLQSTVPKKSVLPLVIGAGFARRMHHFTSLAMYGAHNGFFVSRYDPVNHVGLSEGDMWDFTLSSSLESLRAAVDWTCEHTGQPRVAVIATSLTARVAFELAAQSDKVGAVVSAVGVTNVRHTLSKVFDTDYMDYATEDLPEYVLFEGKKIGPGVAEDARTHDWCSLDKCIATLSRVKQPLVNFIGSDDTWVDPADVHRAFSEGAAGPRKLLTLERAPHDLGRNAAVAQTFLVRAIEELQTLAGLPVDAQIPPFELMMNQALLERRIQRNPNGN